jgi:hypothetical protein
VARLHHTRWRCDRIAVTGVDEAPTTLERRTAIKKAKDSMTSQWQYQVRFDLKDTGKAESIRREQLDPALAPLLKVLAEHRAVPKCQFDAFAEYVAAAEEQGVENYPLYQWTKATIENPAKKEKYLKSFTLYVDGQEVYTKEIADALEADLQSLAKSGLIARISKYDTNPANNPQPPQRPSAEN